MTSITLNPFILIDGSFYLYKSYYAFPFLINEKGASIGAIYGVLNIIKNLLIKYHPSHMAIVFDTKGKTFRHFLFKEYKSHRPHMPKKLFQQIQPLFNIIISMGIPLCSINEVEADDVIGTLALSAAQDGKKVIISTGDKDIAQLISKNISIIDSTLKNISTPVEIYSKFGVYPQLIVDYLALVGDRSDNIPGVRGIGKKTAVILLQKIGDLLRIYENLNIIHTLNIRKSFYILNQLKNGQEIAFLSYKLATIKTDIFLERSHSQLIIQKPYNKLFISLFEINKFKKILQNIQLDNAL